ncbi:MAG TPA: glycosyltransferase family 39 protein [Nitrospira sp.]|nr:glycosyltransferase family 39 protein [Nitrospira sp.]MBS0173619.1 glycosyltransferase family 39 protein [Nitrospira sp.]MBX3336887.1 glycosyltransferase family 39 protein [Nitrospira sp.]MCW5779455.1 glycosyltransferase family 39 protein [Nitrospira sp.]HNA25558.1 glycosyltransferase family 39 protein [Nitrospira sp.]
MWRSGERVSVDGVIGGQESKVPLRWEAEARRYVEMLLLVLICGWGYFANLHLSLLEGSEGLYAGIAGEMGRRNEFFDLTYHGEPYFNKPPLFFWLLHWATSLWGDQEIALRIPGSLAAIGTVVLVYVLGTRLLSSTAGFWAALVVATSHVFLWYGRRVLFDSTLTFLVTLALFAWVQVQILGRSSRWYLLAFCSMALGAMLKEMHGFFLPLLVMSTYACIQRDARMLRDRWFWAGLGLAIAMMAGYALMLGPGYQHHFRIMSAIGSVWNSGLAGSVGVAKDGHPLYWYLGMMWADFFPWCALLPSAVLLLWAQRPLRAHPTELLLLVWVLSLFTAFSLATLKREPYLVTIVPGIGLMIGYFYHRMFTSGESSRAMPPLLKVLLAILAVVFAAGMFFGAAPLRRRWLVSSPVVSPVFIVTIVGLAGTLLFAVVKARLHLALHVVGLLAVAYVVLVVNYVFPAIDQAASPRKATEEIKVLARGAGPALFMYIPGWPKNEDALYYLKRDTVVPELSNVEAVHEAVRTHGQVRIVTEEQHMMSLQRLGGLVVERLQEFQQPGRKHLFLLSVNAKT